MRYKVNFPRGTISPFALSKNRNGLLYTDFNRTVYALANENILDMQGITEAVSRYFYSNGDSFDGLFIAPEYQDRFEWLVNAAMAYYES